MNSSVINMLQGDCMDLMRDKPDKFWDLAIVDPPYGIGASEMTMGSGKHKFKRGKKWDNSIPDKKYFDELFRVSKNQIIWGGNYFTEYLKHSNNWIIWDKLNPNLSFSEAELAWCSIDKNIRIFKKYSVLVEGNGKIHPNQKSVKLYEWLLMNYAKPGDRIIDTHGGSGSICIACHNLGFDLDWIELDPDYYRDAVKRFENHKAQLRMF